MRPIAGLAVLLQQIAKNGNGPFVGFRVASTSSLLIIAAAQPGKTPEGVAAKIRYKLGY